MEKPLSILVLEDNQHDVVLLERVLRKSGMQFTFTVVDSEKAFIAELLTLRHDLILSDHSMNGFDSLAALDIKKRTGLDLPFILVTGTISEEFAVQCMKAGADDYLLKDKLTRLPSAIVNSLEKRQIGREKSEIESLHAQLQKAHAEAAELHKDMLDSIKYARHIQEAMLPPKTLLAQWLPLSFILYKPKDIISGDFYWFNERDGKILIAVADCTGHGVPGALMSMIGTNLLNDIILTKKQTDPGLILQQLNDGIRRLLRQEAEASRAQDGMDIGLVSIDLERKELQFAGANHHLFFFRGKTLELVKGNRRSAGGRQYKETGPYTTHTISFGKGDTLYLFSDGYADQFGGRTERRMQTRNLVKLLQSTLALGFLQQENLLLEWLGKWKGDLKQTDDILLIGIQL